MVTKRYKPVFKDLEARRWPSVRMLVEDPNASRRRARGRSSVFDDKTRARLVKLLLQCTLASVVSTEVWTRVWVATLIERESGHAFCISYRQTMLREMGFTSQRPVGRATQQDEQAILDWRVKFWAALKQTPDETEATSACSTSPA